jgi:DNA-binding transcriptional MerR regulator
MESKQHLSIREISRLCSIPSHTIRYYEKVFPEFLSVSRSHGGHRQYSLETVKKLQLIVHLIEEKGLTLRGVRQVLAEGLATTPPGVSDLPEKRAEDEILDEKNSFSESPEADEANPGEEENLVQTLLRICREKSNQLRLLQNYHRTRKTS